jgi:hypothetical protein
VPGDCAALAHVGVTSDSLSSHQDHQLLERWREVWARSIWSGFAVLGSTTPTSRTGEWRHRARYTAKGNAYSAIRATLKSVLKAFRLLSGQSSSFSGGNEAVSATVKVGEKKRDK